MSISMYNPTLIVGNYEEIPSVLYNNRELLNGDSLWSGDVTFSKGVTDLNSISDWLAKPVGISKGSINVQGYKIILRDIMAKLPALESTRCFSLMQHGSVVLNRTSYARLMYDISCFRFLSFSEIMKAIYQHLGDYADTVVTDCPYLLSLSEEVSFSTVSVKTLMEERYHPEVDTFTGGFKGDLLGELKGDTIFLMLTNSELAASLAKQRACVCNGEYKTMACTLINLDKEK